MLLLHVQQEHNYALTDNGKLRNVAYASNKTLKEAIADLNAYHKAIGNRTMAPAKSIMLLSVSVIEELNTEELKSMNIYLIEGVLEALKNHPAMQ